ncbi:CDP diacylglycerol glycerol 3 phosphate [Echinococcus multilocularis]|uniref:CDP-diacylglycerol--glycerol-3-phosphate 3-phosphatidyltransferase n=1 Tax=Echinococcus multilocularis TaxID=6211 RepID=A0A068Y930_ECHMU|nr:CDP diacylglycerol glycerol 3 phosphate [Echinococcus multilocularis]
MDPFDLVSEEVPSIPFEQKQLEILASPDVFYNAVESGIKTTRRRIVLATLYLGTGELEKRLVKAIVENKNNPRVTLLADAIRSTRTLKATAEFSGVQGCGVGENTSITTQHSPLFLLQQIARLPSSRVALYQSHRVRGWMHRILPERLNELLGLQHMKVCVFDDDVIVSGANLSEEYFKTRQDRAWLFRGVPALADFYSNLIDVVVSLSYRVTPEGELKTTSKETDPELADEKAYCDLFRSRIEAFLTEAKTKYATAIAPRAYDSAVFPIVQMGAYGIQQEVPLLQRLLHVLPACDIAFTTGYFCPTQELEVAMTAIARLPGHPSSQVHILCAAPQANSFFNSKGLAGVIPAAYREMLISFLQHTARLPNIHVHEYFRPGWTFHAKGLWLTTRGTAATTLAFVGSSNYGYRSRNLDLESQVVVVTRDVKLQRRIEAERRWLWDARYLRPVTLQGLLLPTEPRFKWFIRWTLPFLRRIM